MQIEIVRDSYDMRHKYGFGFKDILIDRERKLIKIDWILCKEPSLELDGKEVDTLLEEIDQLQKETKAVERSCLLHILKKRGVFDSLTGVFDNLPTNDVPAQSNY